MLIIRHRRDVKTQLTVAPHCRWDKSFEKRDYSEPFFLLCLFFGTSSLSAPAVPDAVVSIYHPLLCQSRLSLVSSPRRVGDPTSCISKSSDAMAIKLSDIFRSIKLLGLPNFLVLSFLGSIGFESRLVKYLSKPLDRSLRRLSPPAPDTKEGRLRRFLMVLIKLSWDMCWNMGRRVGKQAHTTERQHSGTVQYSNGASLSASGKFSIWKASAGSTYRWSHEWSLMSETPWRRRMPCQYWQQRL